MKRKAVFATMTDLDSGTTALGALGGAGESAPPPWASVLRYGVAILVVLLAGALTFLVPPIAEGAPFLFFLAAVMLSAWYGGLGPALLTILLAAVWSTSFVLPPVSALQLGAPADLLRLGVFLLVAVLISSLQVRQQRTAAAERLQREYWQTTLSSVGDAVIVTDAQGKILVMNPVAQRLTGWTLREAHRRALADVFIIINEDTRQAVENPVAQVLRTGGVVALANHTVLLRKDGSVCPIDDSAAPIRDEHGRLLGIVLVFRDITARRQAEHALRASEEKYRGLFNAIDEGFCLIEKVDGAAGQPVEFRYLEVNPAFATQTGASDVLGKTIGQVFPSEPQEWRDTYDAVLRTGEPRRFERTLVSRGRELELYAFRVEDGTQRRVAVLFKDVTARKQAAEASLRLAALVESSDDAIVSKSLEGIVTSWNTGAERIFGYRAAEMIGQPILRILPAERHAEEDMILARLRRGERVDHFETVRQTKDGRLLDVSVTISPIRDEQGRIIGASKIARDITERKRLERQLAQRAAELERLNAELRQFSYVVSHDLQEPLRTITGYVRLLAQRTGDTLGAEAREFMGFVVEGAQRMQQLITDLLAYTRVEGMAREFTAVDCGALLARVLGTLQVVLQESAAEVTADPLPTVRGDAGQLGLVFQNLIGNAVKFRGTAPPRIHLTARREGAQWVFAVRDNGIGLDPQHAERIFQVFQRLHARSEYPGTGIGLAICKKIIERHGGRIWVESQRGQGATFFFTVRDPL